METAPHAGWLTQLVCSTCLHCLYWRLCPAMWLYSWLVCCDCIASWGTLPSRDAKEATGNGLCSAWRYLLWWESHGYLVSCPTLWRCVRCGMCSLSVMPCRVYRSCWHLGWQDEPANCCVVETSQSRSPQSRSRAPSQKDIGLSQHQNNTLQRTIFGHTLRGHWRYKANRLQAPIQWLPVALFANMD